MAMLDKMKYLRIILGAAALTFASCVSAQDEYWHQRVTLFDKLPVESAHIVMLGNSITDGGEFSELFNNENVINRGIRNDVIKGVEKRLGQVTSGHPSKIFLLIGINDISHNLTVDRLASDYEHLVKEIRRQSPESRLYIQSVMPVNNDFKRYKNLTGKGKTIMELNKRLETIASCNGAVFIDLTKALSDSCGKLNKAYTNDGLHLTGAGYKTWAKTIRPYIEE